MIKCIFSDVSERDMDMLISEEVVLSTDFLSIFFDKIGLETASVLSVELSQADPVLGESDITVDYQEQW